MNTLIARYYSVLSKSLTRNPVPMHRRYSRHLLALCMVMLVSACTPPWVKPQPGEDTTIDWHERRLLLADRPDWRAKGRMAMQTADDAWSASMSWIQIGDLYEMELFGPLGGRRLLIEGGRDHVILTTAEGEKFAERSAQRLIERQTGWVMPVDSLRYWVQGMLAPGGSGEEIFDDRGQLQELRQSGWTVRYRGYQDIDGIPMPRKVSLQSKLLKIKFSIRDWRFGYLKRDIG